MSRLLGRVWLLQMGASTSNGQAEQGCIHSSASRADELTLEDVETAARGRQACITAVGAKEVIRHSDQDGRELAQKEEQPVRSREVFCQGLVLSWIPGISLFLPAESAESESEASSRPPARSFPGSPPGEPSGLSSPAPGMVRTAVFCATPGCREPSWNGKPGEYCSRACKVRQQNQWSSLTSASPKSTSAKGRPLSDIRRCPPADPAPPGEQQRRKSEGSIAGAANGAHPQDQRGSEPPMSIERLSKLARQRKKEAVPLYAQIADRIVEVIAFSFPGKEEICDTLCQSTFLGNCWDLGPGGLQIKAPNDPGVFRSFRNAEAAFVALRYWARAGELADVSGEEAAQLRVEETGHEDLSYCGYGSDWAAMLAVLRQKFKPGSALADLLSQTGEAFLLYRVYAEGEDPVWSDNHDASGMNWLGMQLMLIRDEVRNKEGRWTNVIRMVVNTRTGRAFNQVSIGPWMEAVDRAVDSVECAEEERLRPVLLY